MAGLVTAVVLQRAGREVLVVERHGIGGVTTRGSTGKLTALQGDLLARIARQRGADAASTYAAATTLAVGGLRSLIRDLDVDCSLTDADDHTYATERVGADRCIEAHQAAEAAGLPVSWVERTDLPFAIRGRPAWTARPTWILARSAPGSPPPSPRSGCSSRRRWPTSTSRPTAWRSR